MCPLHAASALPVSWVRIDPQAELLAQIHVLQPASFWTAQLDFSKDVAAQSDAIVGLASERPFTYRSLNALHACLENPKLYCRYAAKPLPENMQRVCLILMMMIPDKPHVESAASLGICFRFLR